MTNWLATIEQSIASIAGEPAAALSPLCVATPIDPIYAAIETGRKMDAELIGLCDAEDELEESGVKLVPAPDDYRTPEMVAVVKAGIQARQSPAKTVPTTPAGLAAYLDYLLKRSFGLGGDFYFDGKHETMDFWWRSATSRVSSGPPDIIEGAGWATLTPRGG